MEKAKIVRSSTFETVDFKLEDFKHIKEKNDSAKQANDDDDEDNVA